MNIQLGVWLMCVLNCDVFHYLGVCLLYSKSRKDLDARLDKIMGLFENKTCPDKSAAFAKNINYARFERVQFGSFVLKFIL